MQWAAEVWLLDCSHGVPVLNGNETRTVEIPPLDIQVLCFSKCYFDFWLIFGKL